jgi:hypothetical protein
MVNPEPAAGSPGLRQWAGRIRSSIAFASTLSHFHSSCSQSDAAAERLPTGLAKVIKGYISVVAKKVEHLRSSDDRRLA